MASARASVGTALCHGRPGRAPLPQPRAHPAGNRADSLTSGRGTTAALLPSIMELIEAQLASAEFEATWLEVRYHDGSATVAQVEAAIRRVDELRRLAREAVRRRRVTVTLGSPAPERRAPLGN